MAWFRPSSSGQWLFFARNRHPEVFIWIGLILVFAQQIVCGAASENDQPSAPPSHTLYGYFERLPSIETITFAKLAPGKGDTNGFSPDGKLFTASLRGEDFVVAELRSVDEEPRMTTRTLPIVGRLDSHVWSISGLNLNLGPTNGVSEPDDPAVTLSHQLSMILDEPLNLGVYHLDRGMLKVSSDGVFNGPIAKRLADWGGDATVQGRFVFSSDLSRVEAAEWGVSSKPDLRFSIKYEYASTNTGFFPSSWVCSIDRSGRPLTSYEIKIYRFKVANNLLPDSHFLPQRFIDRGKLPPVGPITLARSNGHTLWLQDGKFQIADVITPGRDVSSKRSQFVVRFVLVLFALGGLAVFIRGAFVSAKRRQREQPSQSE